MIHAFKGAFGISRAFGVYDPVAYANYPGSKHPGTDYALPANTPLFAGMSGYITVYDRDPNLKTGRGKEVVISHGSFQRKLCHMNRIDVVNGQWVNENDPIGLSGYTGYVVDHLGRVGTPGGAHLHDELLIDGVYASLENNLREEEPMPNDGDIANGKRAITGVPDYQPTELELAFYKQSHTGFKQLMYDVIEGMNARIESAKENQDFEQINEPVFKRKGQ